ncbi:myotrophin [Oryzias latipes]|uniref:Uncharacterized protein n=1 Tax=Oryzias latipes TaxID=8090 RepID=A0A3B3HMB0_ORYLA|nr:myotrophin [Oryzias latipes]
MADNKELAWALKTGDLEEVKAKVKTNKEANGILENGRNPLHVASDYGHVDVVEYLISVGADINAKDKYGFTPLISACFEGHLQCVKLLLEKGADRSIKGPNDQTAFEAADSEAIKALFK